MLRRQVSLQDHRQPAGRTKNFRRRIVIRLSRDGLLFNRIKLGLAKQFLQGSQLAADRGAKETVIANLHKSMRKDMLEETLEKLFNSFLLSSSMIYGILREALSSTKD